MNPKDKKDPKGEDLEVKDPTQEEAEEEISPEEEADQEELTLEELRTQLAETRKKLKASNAESAARRKKLEAKEKEEADRKKAELSEVEKAQAEKKEAEEARDRLKQENRDLKIEQEFDILARSMKLSFINETARKDALKALDREAIGEDLEELEEEIKKVIKDRPFLIGKLEQQNINDGSAKGKNNKSSSTQEAISKKRKSSIVSPI